MFLNICVWPAWNNIEAYVRVFLGHWYCSLVILKTALKSYHVHEKCLFHLFMYSVLTLVYFDFVVWGSCSWYSGYFEPGVHMDLGTYLPKRTSLLKMTWFYNVYKVWMVGVSWNQLTGSSGDVQSGPDISQGTLKRYQELRTNDRKIRNRRFYHISTFVFLFIQCTLQSNLIFVSLQVFSRLVVLLSSAEQKVCSM